MFSFIPNTLKSSPLILIPYTCSLAALFGLPIEEQTSHRLLALLPRSFLWFTSKHASSHHLSYASDILALTFPFTYNIGRCSSSVTDEFSLEHLNSIINYHFLHLHYPLLLLDISVV